MLDELLSLREGVGFARESEVALVRVDGSAAATLLNAVATRPPPRRDGLAVAALLLHPDARIYADLLVCADDGGFLLLAEGPTGAELVAHLQACAQGDVEVRDLGPTHRLIGIDGPFSWEPMMEIAGREVLGVPPQTSFRLDPHPGLGLRASRTGEHGYVLVVPREGAETFDALLADLQVRFPGAAPGLAALDLCALENGYFSMRVPNCATLTPVELQLQWRVRPGRPFVGSEALQARQAMRGHGRVTWWLGEPGDACPSAGATVDIAGSSAGTILYATASPLLGRSIGLALLVERWAHPGLPGRTTLPGGETIALCTVSPPLIDNRSLHVRPHQHRFARRAQFAFPPLIARR